MTFQNLPHHHGKQEDSQQLYQALQHTEEFRIISEVFRQLGDPTRVRIFWLLCHCEECVINIAAMMEMSSPAVSHHLRTLRESGLIVGRREGKEVFYKAADTQTGRLLHEMIEKVMQIRCPETDRDQKGE